MTLARASILLTLLVCQAAVRGQDTPSEQQKSLQLTVPNVGKLREASQVWVWANPPSKQPIEVQLETGQIKYSQEKFALKPGERRVLTATPVHTSDGIVWVHAFTSDGEYADAYGSIDVGFSGHLKLSSTQKLSYLTPSSETLTIVDPDGKPFPLSSSLDLKVDSSDAELSSGKQKNSLDFSLDARARISPQFQVTSSLRDGGDVHLSSTLLLGSVILDQQDFTLTADPAWWLPLLLALAGGLLHGIYKVLNAAGPGSWAWNDKVLWSWFGTSAAVLFTSVLLGFLGYLVANLDLLGLKLDPAVLRTYPLLGFLFAYLGLDFLAGKLNILKKTTV